MSFKEKYPDFAAIEGHIRRARAERSVAIAVAISDGIMAVIAGVKSLAKMSQAGLPFERERHVIDSDPFLKRSVPRY